MKNKLSQGFTLIEILVSTFILAVTVMGLVNLFVTSKRYIAISRSRMAGGELGRIFLDSLSMQVRQDTWDTAANDLRIPLGSETRGPVNGVPIVMNGITYTPEYRFSRVREPTTNTDTGLRRVRVDIRWPALNNP